MYKSREKKYIYTFSDIFVHLRRIKILHPIIICIFFCIAGYFSNIQSDSNSLNPFTKGYSHLIQCISIHNMHEK